MARPHFDMLAELGVAGDVLAEVRPARRARIGKGDACVDTGFGEGRVECCPRRERLDGILQRTAVEAGAELRDRTRVTEVVFDGDRAVGVHAEGPNVAPSSAGSPARKPVAGPGHGLVHRGPGAGRQGPRYDQGALLLPPGRWSGPGALVAGQGRGGAAALLLGPGRGRSGAQGAGRVPAPWPRRSPPGAPGAGTPGEGVPGGSCAGCGTSSNSLPPGGRNRCPPREDPGCVRARRRAACAPPVPPV